jgi:5-hydroxyisourate hydrolase
MIAFSQCDREGYPVGRLTTHVLDTAIGKPAAGVTITLCCMTDNTTWKQIGEAKTNADGRTDQPMLTGDMFVVGTYMLTFNMGDYFQRQSQAANAKPGFLDIIPIRFTISDPAGHYHVPLLATPWSYSTYRGS